MDFFNKIDAISKLLGMGKNAVPGVGAHQVRAWRRKVGRPSKTTLAAIVRETQLKIDERRSSDPDFGKEFSVTELVKLAETKWPSAVSDDHPDPERNLLASLPALIRRFLNRIATVGLDDCVKFKPSHLSPGELQQYCLPVRVVLEEDLQRAKAGQKPETSGESAYLTSTHEEFARNENALRVPRFALNRILESARDHILLRGEPGEGKSTGLWLGLAELCDQLAHQLDLDATAHEQDRFRLPLILPLKYLQQQPAENKFNDQRAPSVVDCAIEFALGHVDLPAAKASQLRKFMVNKVERRQFCLLLDALDELPTPFHEHLRKELRSLEGVRVVMTSRLNADAQTMLLNPLRLRMVCFWPREVQEFLKRYFAKSSHRRRILRNVEQRLRLSPGVRALSQIPMLLAMLCYRQERDPTAPIPNSRTELLRDGLLSLMERGDGFRGRPNRSIRNAAKLRLIAELAWRFHERGPLLLEPAGVADCVGAAKARSSELAGTSADELLGELLRDGILVQHGGGYSFALRSFHEFGVASYLGELCQGSFSREDIIHLVRSEADRWPHQPSWRGFKPLNQPGWLHIWPLAAGCAAPRSWIVEALADEARQNEDCLSSRTIRLAHALGEFANQPAVTSSGNEIRDSLLPWLIERLIDQLGGDRLRDQELEPYATGFAQLPTMLGAKRLIDRMSDSRRSDFERCNYAFVLGEFALPIAISALEKILRAAPAKDGKLQGACASALGRIGTDRAKEAILARLKSKIHRHAWLELGCLSALERFGDDDYAELLNQIMGDKKQPVELRAHAVALAAKTDWLQCSAAILGVLAEPQAASDRDDSHLRECCLKTLGELGTIEARDALLNWLKARRPDELSLEAIRALASIGDSVSVQTIEQIAKLFGGPIQVRAQIELARLGNVAVRELLRGQLRRSPPVAPSLAETIVRLLAIGASEDDVETLSMVLRTSKDEALRHQAAQGLAKIGTDNAVTVLEDAVEDLKTPDSVLWTCAIEGTRQSSRACRTTLLKLLRGSSADVTKLQKAIDALAKDSSPEARDELISLARHQNEYVRSAVRVGLWQIHRTTGHRWLQSGSWESP